MTSRTTALDLKFSTSAYEALQRLEKPNFGKKALENTWPVLTEVRLKPTALHNSKLILHKQKHFFYYLFRN